MPKKKSDKKKVEKIRKKTKNCQKDHKIILTKTINFRFGQNLVVKIVRKKIIFHKNINLMT